MVVRIELTLCHYHHKLGRRIRCQHPGLHLPSLLFEYIKGNSNLVTELGFEPKISDFKGHCPTVRRFRNIVADYGFEPQFLRSERICLPLAESALFEPMGRIELPITVYRTVVMPFNYKGL